MKLNFLLSDWEENSTTFKLDIKELKSQVFLFKKIVIRKIYL